MGSACGSEPAAVFVEGGPRDAGVQYHADSGALGSSVDGGDAAPFPSDAGMPSADAGLPPPPDGGPPPPDGGPPPSDAGNVPSDAGDVPSDAGAADAGPYDAGPYDAGIGSATPVDGGTCTLTTNTYATSVTNPTGCNVLVRDAAGCVDARTALGLGSFWLRFSCRVTLSREGSGAGAVVVASSDNQPDYKSNYFTDAHACREVYTSAIMNPNRIATKSLSVRFPVAPNSAPGMMTSAVVGLAVNGVAIFGNFAAPGDDIYQEAKTFDRCGAHPQGAGTYHYHSEPYAITYDDGNFVGVLRDGYPVYGRREPDGSMPASLDAYGGHTGLTIDSPATPVYHYHVNAQTSTAHGTHGDTQWFLTTGSYRGAPATCTTCN